MDVFGAERVGGDDGDERRVDPARETDHDVGEPVLAAVVAGAEHERLVQLLVRVEWVGDRSVDERIGRAPAGVADVHDRELGLGVLAARVEQTVPVHRRDRHVDDHQVFDELWGAGQQLAFGVDHERSTVEHELVLSADLVDVGDRGVGVLGAGGDHPFPSGVLLPVIRRSVDVDAQLGASGGLHGERSER